MSQRSLLLNTMTDGFPINVCLGLPHCKLSQHLENRVNNFLKKKEPGTGIEVVIRVLSSSDKEVEVKQHMKNK